MSELFDAVNLSGQCHLGRDVEMASTVVLTDTNVSERRDDGGFLWSTDGDVTTVHDAVNTSGQRQPGRSVEMAPADVLSDTRTTAVTCGPPTET